VRGCWPGDFLCCEFGSAHYNWCRTRVVVFKTTFGIQFLRMIRPVNLTKKWIYYLLCKGNKWNEMWRFPRTAIRLTCTNGRFFILVFSIFTKTTNIITASKFVRFFSGASDPHTPFREFMLIMWVGHLVGVVSDWAEHYSYSCYVTNTRRRCNWSNAKVGFFWKRSDHVQVDEMNSRSKICICVRPN
jgi:hypothetical protein